MVGFDKLGRMPRDPLTTRRRLIGAATAEFAEFGFAGARVHFIADICGISKERIYGHFGNKTGLYNAAFEQLCTGLLGIPSVQSADGFPELFDALHDALMKDAATARLLYRERIDRHATPALMDTLMTKLGEHLQRALPELSTASARAALQGVMDLILAQAIAHPAAGSSAAAPVDADAAKTRLRSCAATLAQSLIEQQHTIPANSKISTANLRKFLFTTVRHATSNQQTWSSSRHFRDELVWSTAGTLRVQAAHALWTVPAHQALWLPRDVPHSIDVSAGTLLQATYFSRGAVATLPPRVCLVQLSPALRELLLFNAEHAMPDERRLRLQQLAVELIHPAVAAEVDLKMPRSALLIRVAEGILGALDAKTSTGEWATILGMTPRDLSAAFQEETGLSLTQWRVLARIRASLILLDSGIPVATTARRLGYASPSTFINHFRTTMGSTPAAYLGHARD
ncbi:helix-turn-helix domain-containing protein [Glutamicibacter sp. NPDC087344]|uniref:helix-turn-helix domain-containing protein n=1 Tax=Glutamicibacter sp. NPDC087344 TaxID=3363994 RepID=UPI003819A0BB